MVLIPVAVFKLNVAVETVFVVLPTTAMLNRFPCLYTAVGVGCASIISVTALGSSTSGSMRNAFSKGGMPGLSLCSVSKKPILNVLHIHVVGERGGRDCLRTT
ncbi:hypothetical protein F5B21DRAFT_88341 [Xylaria acuta]|nr:hypothetical protein F5B21DRAFT_88341 [Xylaria acuta]